MGARTLRYEFAGKLTKPDKGIIPLESRFEHRQCMEKSPFLIHCTNHIPHNRKAVEK
jgi:hypothetical protein